MKNKNKKIFTVSAVDKDGISRCYGTAEYPEDAKLQCIMALAERCLRKLENGVRFVDGGDTDFYSYKFKDAQKGNMEKEIEEIKPFTSEDEYEEYQNDMQSQTIKDVEEAQA